MNFTVEALVVDPENLVEPSKVNFGCGDLKHIHVGNTPSWSFAQERKGSFEKILELKGVKVIASYARPILF